jgi:predicted GNAT family acetyltransferase
MIPPARRLEPHEDLANQILAVLDRNPIINCFLYSRLEPLFSKSIRPGQSMKGFIGGDVWLHEEDGEIAALCYVGANLVPTPASDRAIEAFAKRARRVGRYSSSIVGPNMSVLGLWEQVADAWSPARAVREYQPVLSIDHLPLVPTDDSVRRAEPVEIPQLLPASVAMFTEELGISPIGADGGALYRAKLAEQIAGGLVFARFENGEVIFKCEIGAISPSACQIQGVWTKPDRRGEGIGTAGLARVVEIALGIAPTVCLYVNGFNIAARRSYEKIGFREVGAFASVLF